jgi:hypothetical protein
MGGWVLVPGIPKLDSFIKNVFRLPNNNYLKSLVYFFLSLLSWKICSLCKKENGNRIKFSRVNNRILSREEAEISSITNQGKPKLTKM